MLGGQEVEGEFSGVAALGPSCIATARENLRLAIDARTPKMGVASRGAGPFAHSACGGRGFASAWPREGQAQRSGVGGGKLLHRKQRQGAGRSASRRLGWPRGGQDWPAAIMWRLDGRCGKPPTRHSHTTPGTGSITRRRAKTPCPRDGRRVPPADVPIPMIPQKGVVRNGKGKGIVQRQSM
jgi:hypothetical protein